MPLPRRFIPQTILVEAKNLRMEWKSQSSIVIVFLQSPHLWKNVDVLYLKIKAMNNVHDIFSGIRRNSVEKQFLRGPKIFFTQWNLGITNHCNEPSPRNNETNPDITTPRSSKHDLLVPWPFVVSRFHSTIFYMLIF